MKKDTAPPTVTKTIKSDEKSQWVGYYTALGSPSPRQLIPVAWRLPAPRISETQGHYFICCSEPYIHSLSIFHSN